MEAGEKFSGQVRLCSDDRELGFVRVELFPAEARPGESAWGGIIAGSDYLMWGGNHQQLSLEFDDGEIAAVVIRATGRIIGQGDPPSMLTAKPA